MKNKENIEKKPKNFKKFKYGSMSVVVIVLVVAIVVTINIIVSMLMKRYPLKLDLTSDSRYELCDETIDVLKKMESDVEIAVMMPESTLLNYKYYNMIPKILENYQVYAEAGKGSIEVKYIDTTKDPDEVSKYSKYYNGNITDGSVVVYSNEKVKVTSVSAMISSNSQSSYYGYSGDVSYSFVGESTLTSAIMSVTDANPMRAAFMSYMDAEHTTYVYGSNSSAYGAESFKNLLSKNGYECTDVDIYTCDISPEDYDLVVIPAPAYDLSEDAVAKIEDFLFNDGNYEKHMIYIAGLDSAELPHINELLNKWNIEIGDSVVGDDVNMMNASLYVLNYETAASPIVSVSDTEAVGTLPNETLPIIAPFSRNINIIEKNSEYVTSPVLTTAKTAHLSKLDGSESDVTGEQNVMVLSKRERAEQLDVYTSSILAIGSVYMSDPSILTNTNSYNNANLLINAVNTMTGKENSFVIPQKNLQEETLSLTAGQIKGVRTFVVFIIPLIVIVIGIAVYIRRRNR